MAKQSCGTCRHYRTDGFTAMIGRCQDWEPDAMNPAYAALAEAIAHGLNDGWKSAHCTIRQPTKDMLLSHLYQGVMDRMVRLIEAAEARQEPRHDP